MYQIRASSQAEYQNKTLCSIFKQARKPFLSLDDTRIKRVSKNYTDHQLTKPYTALQRRLLNFILLSLAKNHLLRHQCSMAAYGESAGCSDRYIRSCIPLFIARNDLVVYIKPNSRRDRRAQLVYGVPSGSINEQKLKALQSSGMMPSACSYQLFLSLMLNLDLSKNQPNYLVNILRHTTEIDTVFVNCAREAKQFTRMFEKLPIPRVTLAIRSPMSELFVIPDYILAIRSFKPTQAGQVSLLGFRPEAIREADNWMSSYKGEIRDPLGYLCKLATKWHIEHNAEVDTDRVITARHRYGFTVNTVGFEIDEDRKPIRPSMIKVPIHKKDTPSNESRGGGDPARPRIPMFVMPVKVIRPSSEVAIEAANFITLKDQTPSWMQEFLQQRIIKGHCEPDYIEAVARENQASEVTKPINANPLLEPTKTNLRPSLANIAASFTPVPIIPPVTTQQREIEPPLLEEEAPSLEADLRNWEAYEDAYEPFEL